MKFATALPIAALVLGAMAETPSRVQYEPTLVERDVATISSVVANLNSLASGLATAVQGFSGDIAPLESAAAAIQAGIQSGVSAIEATSPLTLTEALQLQPLVQSLTDTANNVVDAVIAKKPDIVAAGFGGTVLQQLKDQQTGAQTLAKTITSKVPPDVQALAATLSAGINDAFQRGVDAYQDQAGQPTGGSGGGSGSSSAPPAGSSSAPRPSGSSAPPSSSRPPASSPTASASGSASGSGSSARPPTASATPPRTTGGAPPAFTGAASANKVAGGLIAAVAVAVAAL